MHALVISAALAAAFFAGAATAQQRSIAEAREVVNEAIGILQGATRLNQIDEAKRLRAMSYLVLARTELDPQPLGLPLN
jgi:hypothetical protein